MFWFFRAQSSCGVFYNQLCTKPNPCSIPRTWNITFRLTSPPTLRKGMPTMNKMNDVCCIAKFLVTNGWMNLQKWVNIFIVILLHARWSDKGFSFGAPTIHGCTKQGCINQIIQGLRFLCHVWTITHAAFYPYHQTVEAGWTSFVHFVRSV